MKSDITMRQALADRLDLVEIMKALMALQVRRPGDDLGKLLDRVLDRLNPHVNHRVLDALQHAGPSTEVASLVEELAWETAVRLRESWR